MSKMYLLIINNSVDWPHINFLSKKVLTFIKTRTKTTFSTQLYINKRLHIHNRDRRMDDVILNKIVTNV